MERIANRQKVVTSQNKHQDVFAVVRQGDKGCLAVLRFREGLLCATEHFIFDFTAQLPETRTQLLLSYYGMQRDIPPKILIDGDVADRDDLVRFLEEKRQKKVELTVPQIGDGHRLIQMCLANAAQKLGDYAGRKGTQTTVLDELAKTLGLPRLPVYIEAYDISHTAGADNVCGMVVFRDARPLKSAYRRFAVKGFDGQDDYGSMREVLSRRLNRYMEEQGSGEGFGRLPDLILLDGGQGQVNAVKPIIDAMGLDIPVFGMVKDSKHRTRAIATGGEEIEIRDGRRVFTLVSSIQEEVHRFSIAYHKEKHTRGTVSTTLVRIPGIGEKKAKALLKTFGSLKKIRAADEASLCAVPGISQSNARAIRAFFDAQETDA